MALAPDGTASTTTGISEVLIKNGEVIWKGKTPQLTLLENGLRLTCTVQDQSGTNVEKRVLDLSWRDVVCACETPVKKSKSAPGEATAAQRCSTFVIHYINKSSQKSPKLHCHNVQLELTDGTSAGVWISQIEEKRKKGKPQKLLVVINPIGGKGTAQQTYEKQVQPLFALAGIETVVKITERAKHALEIGKTFDISTVDGVVSVGGDGLYAELLHAFVLRAQEEAGVNINDPIAKLVPPSVRIGIVPAGTGNGVSQWLNENAIDVKTATLNIIRGETHGTGIFSVHEPGKLIFYSGLLVANGYFSQIVKRAEELRWMKRARYPYAMLTSLFGKKPVLDMEIEVLHKSPQEPENKPDEAGDSVTVEATGSAATGWTKLGVKHVTATIAFVAQISEVDEEKVCFNPFHDSCDLWMLSQAGGFSNLKFIFGLFARKRSALNTEFVEQCRDIIGYRIHIVDEQAKDEAAASGPSHSDLSKLLDVDGELFACSVPQFEIRLHPNFIQVFSVNNFKEQL